MPRLLRTKTWLDPLDDLGARPLRAPRRGDGARDAQPPRLEGQARPRAVGVDHQPDLLAADRTADIVVAEKLAQKRERGAFVESTLLRPSVDDQRVGGPRAKLGEEPLEARLDVEFQPQALGGEPSRESVERGFGGSMGGVRR